MGSLLDSSLAAASFQKFRCCWNRQCEQISWTTFKTASTPDTPVLSVWLSRGTVFSQLIPGAGAVNPAAALSVHCSREVSLCLLLCAEPWLLTDLSPFPGGDPPPFPLPQPRRPPLSAPGPTVGSSSSYLTSFLHLKPERPPPVQFLQRLLAPQYQDNWFLRSSAVHPICEDFPVP